MSHAVAIAEALKDDLNAGYFTKRFQATRDYFLDNDFPLDAEIFVGVSPAIEESLPDRGSRHHTARQYTINVYIGKTITAVKSRRRQQIDDLMTFAEEVTQYVEANDMPLSRATADMVAKTYAGAVWTATDARQRQVEVDNEQNLFLYTLSFQFVMDGTRPPEKDD